MNSKVEQVLYSLDWIKILHKAIENRRSSWGERPVVEWRNASDEVCSAVLVALREETGYDPWKEAMKDVSSGEGKEIEDGR